MQEKENILRILKETIIALKKTNSPKLKSLSDQTNHTVTVYQDADNIVVAVLVYSLSKIVERENYRNMEGWKFFSENIIKYLNLGIKSLENNDLEGFRNNLGELRNSINKMEGDLKNYISDVFYKAGINKAFKFYEHGLSSQRTADLLGVSLWDLSSYIGQSNIAESKISESVPIKARIQLVEEFFI